MSQTPTHHNFQATFKKLPTGNHSAQIFFSVPVFRPDARNGNIPGTKDFREVCRVKEDIPLTYPSPEEWKQIFVGNGNLATTLTTGETARFALGLFSRGETKNDLQIMIKAGREILFVVDGKISSKTPTSYVKLPQKTGESVVVTVQLGGGNSSEKYEMQIKMLGTGPCQCETISGMDGTVGPALAKITLLS